METAMILHACVDKQVVQCHVTSSQHAFSQSPLRFMYSWRVLFTNRHDCERQLCAIAINNCIDNLITLIWFLVHTIISAVSGSYQFHAHLNAVSVELLSFSYCFSVCSDFLVSNLVWSERLSSIRSGIRTGLTCMALTSQTLSARSRSFSRSTSWIPGSFRTSEQLAFRPLRPFRCRPSLSWCT